jgi:CopG family nickel-responsive transcriptional regulator
MFLKRFGVAVPEDLLERFDEIVEKRGYVGRSEAIRDAMREFLSRVEWEDNATYNLATVNIVYRHKPALMSKLIEAQHNAKAHIVSAVHTHLTRTHCLEILTLEGTRDEIQSFTDKIGGFSGIEYVRLFTFSLPDEVCQTHTH